MRAVVDHTNGASSAHGGPASLIEADAGRMAGEPGFSLSIVMPVHNEARTVRRAIEEVLSLEAPFPFELIVVDDGSTDGSSLIIRSIDDARVVRRRHDAKLGKGSAVLSGAGSAHGTHLVVLDADLEYSAGDVLRVCGPILDGRAAVVYGARVFGMNTVYHSYRYALGNRATTLVANVLFDSCLTDLHTCLKVIPLSLFRDLQLGERGFGLDTEITGELLRRGFRPFEVPVSYQGRSRADGKKLTWMDGVSCLAVLARVRLRGAGAGSQSSVGPAARGDRPSAP